MLGILNYQRYLGYQLSKLAATNLSPAKFNWHILLKRINQIPPHLPSTKPISLFLQLWILIALLANWLF